MKSLRDEIPLCRERIQFHLRRYAEDLILQNRISFVFATELT